MGNIVYLVKFVKTDFKLNLFQEKNLTIFIKNYKIDLYISKKIFDFERPVFENKMAFAPAFSLTNLTVCELLELANAHLFPTLICCSRSFPDSRPGNC